MSAPRAALTLLLLAFVAALAPLPVAAQTLSPPSSIKTFGAATIPLNGTTSLQVIIVNPNATTALTGVAFTDILPAGLIIASNPQLASLCGGTATAIAGASSWSLSGGTVAANSNCNVLVNVTGIVAGIKNNSVTVTSTNGGTGNTATASLTVLSPPTISKAFGASSMVLGATTSLSFTVTNPNPTAALTGVAFTDLLPNGSGIPPGGLVVASPSGLTGSCGSGTITAVAGSGSVALAGGTIAASGTCMFSVNVTGNVAGLAENTTGNVSSANGGTGNEAIASVNVVAPPAIIKEFGAASIPLNGTTQLSIGIFNPNPNQTLTGVGFTDILPAGLVVATPNGVTSVNCTGGTITATAGSGSLSLSGVSLPATEPCTVNINVTGTTAGVKNNVTSAVTSTEGGSGLTASASITVVAPPTIAKAFGAQSIPVGGQTPLTFTITNPNATVALTGVSVSDSLPAGLVVSTPDGLSGSCSGGTFTAVSGSSSISIAGAIVPAGGTCTFTVGNILGVSAGVMTNVTSAITSTEGGSGNTASASLTVVAPPTITKAFGAASIPLGGQTPLTFTITNPNATVALTGVSVSDSLPAGLVISTPSGQSGNCAGTFTAVSGSTSISFAGMVVPAGGTCTFTVGNILGVSAGVKNNVTGAVSSTEGGTGGTAAATVTVLAPSIPVPSLSGWSLLLLVLAFVAIGVRWHYRRTRTR